MNRLIIESLEGRILTGITMFVAVMVLVGWVAINEPARMKAFEEQQLGRSIERGGELFAANCATCHGANGYGQAGRAPALNNPQLFGYDPFNGINDEIGRLQRQQQNLRDQIAVLDTEREGLITQATQPNADTAAITARVTEIDNAKTTLETQIADYVAQTAPLLEQRDAIVLSLDAAILKGYFPGIENQTDTTTLAYTEFLAQGANRLVQAGWGGDLAAFLRTTLIHGRPGTAAVWNNAQMVAWAQTGGGPLRTDQINDLVNFILNWDKGENWTAEDLFLVEQYMKLKADASLVSAGPAVETLSALTTIDEQVAAVSALTGDATRGQALYNGVERTEARQRLGCSSCHLGGANAPATEATWDTVQAVRLQDAALTLSGANRTEVGYLVQSIIHPNDYVVAPYASGVMPQNYGEQLTAQDLADILAYLKTYSAQQ